MQRSVDIIGSSTQLSASSLDASALLSTSTLVSPRRAAMSQQGDISVHSAASSLGAGGQAMGSGAMSLQYVVGPVGAWSATGLGGHEPLTPLYLSCKDEVQAILNRQDKDEKIVHIADQLESLFTKVGLMYRMQIAPARSVGTSSTAMAREAAPMQSSPSWSASRRKGGHGTSALIPLASRQCPATTHSTSSMRGFAATPGWRRWRRTH